MLSLVHTTQPCTWGLVCQLGTATQNDLDSNMRQAVEYCCPPGCMCYMPVLISQPDSKGSLQHNLLCVYRAAATECSQSSPVKPLPYASAAHGLQSSTSSCVLGSIMVHSNAGLLAPVTLSCAAIIISVNCRNALQKVIMADMSASFCWLTCMQAFQTRALRSTPPKPA